MRYIFAILLLPFSVFADPKLDIENDVCDVYTAGQIPEFQIEGCYFAQQASAATARLSRVYPESFFANIPINTALRSEFNTDSSMAPGVLCTFNDNEGNAHTSTNWETKVIIKPRSRDKNTGERLMWVKFELYCHRDDAPDGSIGPMLNLSNRSCRSYLGDAGPDVEGNYCYFSEDGKQARFGHFLFHKYLHITDTIPQVNIGQTVTITANSGSYPGVPCIIFNEDGMPSQTYDWTSKTEIRSQYDGDNREIVDRVLLDITCNLGPQ